MTTSPAAAELEIQSDMTHENNLTFDSNQLSTDEQLSQIIDSINLPETSGEIVSNASQSESTTTTTTTTTTESSIEPPARHAVQSEIGAKIAKKLETLGKP